MDAEHETFKISDREVWDALEIVRLYVRERDIDPQSTVQELHEQIGGIASYLDKRYDQRRPYPGDDA